MSDPLGTIEGQARIYADALRDLAERMAALDADVAAAKRQHIHPIKRLAAKAAAAKQELIDTVGAQRSLFRRPRTRILHGIKIGLLKGKGRLCWGDTGQVIRLIRKHLGDREAVLVKTTESVVRGALAQLAASDLQKIGVTVEDTGDRIVVEQTDADIEKLVNALLSPAKDVPGGDEEDDA